MVIGNLVQGVGLVFRFEVMPPDRWRCVGNLFKLAAEIRRFTVSHHFGYFDQGIFGKINQELFCFFNPQGVDPPVEILLFFHVDKF